MSLEKRGSVSFRWHSSASARPSWPFCVTPRGTLLQPPVTDVSNADLACLAGHAGDVTHFIRHFPINSYQVGRLQLPTLNVCLNLEWKQHHALTRG